MVAVIGDLGEGVVEVVGGDGRAEGDGGLPLGGGAGVGAQGDPVFAVDDAHLAHQVLGILVRGAEVFFQDVAAVALVAAVVELAVGAVHGYRAAQGHGGHQRRLGAGVAAQGDPADAVVHDHQALAGAAAAQVLGQDVTGHAVIDAAAEGAVIVVGVHLLALGHLGDGAGAGAGLGAQGDELVAVDDGQLAQVGRGVAGAGAGAAVGEIGGKDIAVLAVVPALGPLGIIVIGLHPGAQRHVGDGFGLGAGRGAQGDPVFAVDHLQAAEGFADGEGAGERRGEQRGDRQQDEQLCTKSVFHG